VPRPQRRRSSLVPARNARATLGRVALSKKAWLLLVPLGILGSCGPFLAIGGMQWWVSRDARAFVDQKLREARADADPFVDDTEDTEKQEAWRLVGKSTDHTLPWFVNSQGTGTPFSEWLTIHCMNVTLATRKGSRTLGILVNEQTSQGKTTLSVGKMSARRECTCSGKHKPCRLE